MAATTGSLIVPIDVAALCVGRTDVNGSGEVPYGTVNFARVASDFSNLPYLDREGEEVQPHNVGPNITDLALPRPFTDTSNALEEGIHLHWSLPDALSHGTTNSNGRIEFREAPNRWLIVRIASSHERPESPDCAMKAWIIESDYLQDDAAEDTGALAASNSASRDVPLEPVYDIDQLPNKSYKKLGRIFEYNSWNEGDGAAYLSTTTAVGYGIPTYAAAYDNCRNVFGLHDALDDLDLATFKPGTSRISYAVVGWFSSDDRDPLARLDYPDHASYREMSDAVRRAYAWIFAPDESRPFPSHTFCSGLLCDITWNPDTHYIHPRPDTPLDIAIGNTTVEALSALIAHDPKYAGLQNVERFMNALQLGLLQHLGEPDGLARFEETLHQRGFGSADAGEIWAIKRNDPASPTSNGLAIPAGEHLLDAAEAMRDTLPADIAHDLNDLNIAQQRYDAARSAIDSRRRQIFADWYKYMVKAYPPTMKEHELMLAPPGATDTIDIGDISNFIRDEIDELDEAAGELKNLRDTRDAKHVALANTLGRTHQLARIAAPRYWQANDPVLLFSGADVTPSYRYAGDAGLDKDGNLICRLSSGIISSMSVGDGAFVVRAGDLPLLNSPGHSVHGELLSALVGEAFFIDPNQAWLLARGVAKQGGNGNPAITDRAGFTERVQGAQRNIRAGAPAAPGITFAGIPPTGVGVRDWNMPWIPLLLQWEAHYYPAQSLGDPEHSRDYPTDCITASYHLDAGDTDLVRRDQHPPDLSNRQVHSGSVLLTHNTEINIKAQIDLFLRNFPDDQHAAELKKIRDNLNISAMAQALDGFNNALLMRRQTLQLPVFDPLAPLGGPMEYKFSNELVRDAVGSMNDTAPVPLGDYSPLRAGHLEIYRIRIIDAFGQVREIRNPKIIRAESLAASEDTALLPPRIVQPSRFSFRWISAADDLAEMNSQPASSPIFGWLLFNHLDTSLMIYDATGDPLGSLNLRGDLWRGAPGNDSTYGQPPEKALAGANPHLQKFVLGIFHHPKKKEFLADLLEVLDRATSTILPAGYRQDRGLSLLIGRPLALVRASLDLELQGLPALDVSWNALKEAMPKSAYGQRRSAGFAKVKFPVRLGDIGKIDDGLVGYFIDDNTEMAYQRCFSAAARPGSENGVMQPSEKPLHVDASEGSPGVTVSMIVDPRAPVHATTGILPVKSIAIPPFMYSDALNTMAVTFLTTPLLSGIESLAMPLPREEGYAWSWIAHNASAPGWSTTDAIGEINAQGNFASLPQQIIEGWLKLHRAPSPGTSSTR